MRTGQLGLPRNPCAACAERDGHAVQEARRYDLSTSEPSANRTSSAVEFSIAETACGRPGARLVHSPLDKRTRSSPTIHSSSPDHTQRNKWCGERCSGSPSPALSVNWVTRCAPHVNKARNRSVPPSWIFMFQPPVGANALNVSPHHHRSTSACVRRLACSFASGCESRSIRCARGTRRRRTKPGLRPSPAGYVQPSCQDRRIPTS